MNGKKIIKNQKIVKNAFIFAENIKAYKIQAITYCHRQLETKAVIHGTQLNMTSSNILITETLAIIYNRLLQLITRPSK